VKVVYTAGKISDSRGVWYQQINIRAGMDVAVALWGLGLAVICPQSNTYFMCGACPYETWMQGDFELIRRADALVMVPNWRDSPGATREREFALQIGLPVYYWPHDQHRIASWAKGE
jgi:hypothetical protein